MSNVKCRYSKCSCLHESRELDKQESTRVGSQYFHKDCLQTKNQIEEIVSLFTEKINKNPVYSQLHNVINNIVFKKKLGSDFLLFGLQYYISHKIPLNYPQGLYYVIQNKDVLAAYNKAKTKDVEKSIEITEDNSSTFKYIPTKNNGFADILK